MVLHQWGVLQDNLVLSTGLINVNWPPKRDSKADISSVSRKGEMISDLNGSLR